MGMSKSILCTGRYLSHKIRVSSDVLRRSSVKYGDKGRDVTEIAKERSQFLRLLRSFAAYGMGDFILFGMSYFVLIPSLTHYLSPEEYGIVAVLSAISIILVAIFQFGLPSALFRYYFLHEDGDPRKQYFGTIWLFSLSMSGMLSVGALWLGRPIWDEFIREAPFNVYAGYLIWGAFFQVVIVFRSVLLRAQERPRLYIAMDIAQFLCLVVLVLYHVIILKEGAIGQVRGAFYTYFLFAIISAVIVMRNIRFRPRWYHLKDSLLFAFPVFLTYVIGFFTARANVIILQYFIVGGAIGMFALGQQLGNLISMLSASFEKAWQPFLYGRQPDQARSLLARYLVIATPFYILLALAIGLFAPEVVAVLSSKAYGGAWSIVAITGLGAAFIAISSPSAGAIYYARRSDVSAWITAAAAAVNIGLNLLLVPYWGVMGAAWSSVVVGIGTLMLNVWAMQHYFPINVHYRRLIAAVVLGVLILLAGSVALNGNAALPTVVTLVIKTTAILGYGVLLWVLRIFPSKEDAEIMSYLKRFGKMSGEYAVVMNER